MLPFFEKDPSCLPCDNPVHLKTYSHYDGSKKLSSSFKLLAYRESFIPEHIRRVDAQRPRRKG